MKYAPYVRVALRYIIGPALGLEGMADDPDMVMVGALLLAAAINEGWFILAKMRGWST
ncbi:hypothetical protein [Stappia indica]|uniref:hypothetical protein n=1 Tax=Stappia indica TaxID=538381 RepID=UPI001CD53453|nr:hypothetical protein [Stappia indica]MCA1298047.1 hypothetical protein [Stappia indica]